MAGLVFSILNSLDFLFKGYSAASDSRFPFVDATQEIGTLGLVFEGRRTRNTFRGQGADRMSAFVQGMQGLYPQGCGHGCN